jgi:argininosuccinate lyase
MKLWTKENTLDRKVESFTVGNDRTFDLQLAEFDVLGSIAHVVMLEKSNLVTPAEKAQLVAELRGILFSLKQEEFQIGENAEDIHSHIEMLLTNKLGNAGKKIHTARSRNDQSLLDIKLFLRNELQKTVRLMENLFALLQQLSESNKTVFLPGYTHYQAAMPSSFGLWFGAWAESLCDDLEAIRYAYKLADQNPLGTAAGYGSSFAVDRELTTELLGFGGMNVNSVYAHMSRGRCEKAAAQAIASVASTLSRLASDCVLFLCGNFGFISFPSHLVTGSSIMPHKKNPDVWEIVRAKCNRLQSVPNELALLMGNLPSGYHRDLQLTKEITFPAFSEIQSCLEMTTYVLAHIEIKKDIAEDASYDPVFSVDAVNNLVQRGIPFREAYAIVADAIEKKQFVRPGKLAHTHTGSTGNPGNELVEKRFTGLVSGFQFERANTALAKLAGE